MSERSALVAVLGALDTVIATTEDASERHEMQERVAELIPRYGDVGAVGWFNRAFRPEAPRPTHAEAEADLIAALKGLATTRDVQVSREPSVRRSISMDRRADPTEFDCSPGAGVFVASRTWGMSRSGLTHREPSLTTASRSTFRSRG
jgi:hypothetical protein